MRCWQCGALVQAQMRRCPRCGAWQDARRDNPDGAAPAAAAPPDADRGAGGSQESRGTDERLPRDTSAAARRQRSSSQGSHSLGPLDDPRAPRILRQSEGRESPRQPSRDRPLPGDDGAEQRPPRQGEAARRNQATRPPGNGRPTNDRNVERWSAREAHQQASGWGDEDRDWPDALDAPPEQESGERGLARVRRTATRGSGRGSAPRAPRRFHGWLIAGALAVVLALVAASVLLAPHVLGRLNASRAKGVPSDPYVAPTAGATPTVLAGDTAFTSTRSAYTLNYPKDWTVSSQEHTVQGQYDHVDAFMAAAKNPTMSLYVEQAAAAASATDAQVIASEVSGARSSGVTLAPIAALPQTEIVGGAQWQRRDYTLGSGAAASHEVILACHHAGRAYVIVYISLASNFNQATSAYFLPALRTFRFLVS